MPIRLAFSPDSDDVFMFWALLAGRIDGEGLTFVAEREDTESLNQRAERGDVDVLAVSIARYATIAQDWLLLPHGASVGRGYGPVVVAREPRSIESLAGKRIGVPGLRTTAYLTLRLVGPAFEPVVIPIAPYSKAFDALRSGEVDAVLLIHEGRLTYEREGFHRVLELGEAWAAATGGLPLPLGGNAIRRGLGEETIAKVSRLCRASIAWALEHRDEMLESLLSAEKRPDLPLDRALLDRYLAMYANEDTREMKPDVIHAIRELYARGVAAGLLPQTARLELAP
ncbi:menaquinone biosynthesis family protein [Pendulispora albinea]|uniref:1,4-dihydroxy-6-naphtoate synthase n=1 Tax=Pendulispora albinea TaxID=2741071 RepID=A0ABZ2LUU3_9BACT